MDENAFFDYLLEMGAMRPDDEKLARKQAMVDALRQASFDSPQATQAGRVVVAPSWTQLLGQIGQGWAARKGQKEADKMGADLNATRKAQLEELRRRRSSSNMVNPLNPYEEDPYGLYGSGGMRMS